MLADALNMAAMTCGIPKEAIMAAPMAMAAGLHAARVAGNQPIPIAEKGIWKGTRAPKQLLSPMFIQMSTIGLTVGGVVGAVMVTGAIDLIKSQFGLLV